MDLLPVGPNLEMAEISNDDISGSGRPIDSVFDTRLV